jgi:ribosomal protein S18 acetylase RimI-like enzyme
MNYQFQVARIAHVNPILWLFEQGRKWHAEIEVDQWPTFELARVLDDIKNERLFVLLRGQLVVGSVTISDTDSLIWNDETLALYIHRLVVSRDLKGQDLGKRIIDQIEAIAVDRGRQVLRLDCWASNERLKAYYMRMGFTKLGNVSFGEVPSLPLHYRNSTTTLFERICTGVFSIATQELPSDVSSIS